MHFQNLKHNRINGWLTKKEGELLYRLAQNCTGKGVIMEIGSWMGKSTVYLAQGSQIGNGVTVFAIDPHTDCAEHKLKNIPNTFEIFKENLKKMNVSSIICPQVKYSFEVAKHWSLPIELLFIDGDHQYDSVKQDFELFYPYVIDDGIVAFHDATACLNGLMGHCGPIKFVNNIFSKLSDFKDFALVDTIVYAHKCSGHSLRDRLSTRIFRFQKIFYDAIHKLYHTQKLIRKLMKYQNTL